MKILLTLRNIIKRLTMENKNKDKVILIDNGHGMETKGKCSPDKTLYEWEWTREIASRIVAELRDLGYDARRLVTEDYDVPLKERVRRANAICSEKGREKVTLISVHVNAAGGDGKWHDARGFIPFVAQNAGEGSKRLAKLLYDEAVKRGLKGNRWMPKEGYQTKSLAMCRDTHCAAVLTENLFMDNREDCEMLKTEEVKHIITDMHVAAITKYPNQ